MGLVLATALGAQVDLSCQPPQAKFYVLPTVSVDDFGDDEPAVARGMLRFADAGFVLQRSIDDLAESIFEPPLPKKLPHLRFPRSMRFGQMFRILFLVEKDGTISNLEILRTPHELFNRYLLKSLEDMTFEPGRRDGVPASVNIVWDLPLANVDLEDHRDELLKKKDAEKE